MSEIIVLSKGFISVVDDEDYDLLSQYKWHAFTGKWSPYAQRSVWIPETKKKKRVSMHRFIMEQHGHDLTGLEVDHINRSGLDNRKSNLRVVTSSQNKMNARKRGNTSSQFKGVCWHKPGKKWCAYIDIDGKRKHLGLFRHEIDAARTYNDFAKEHFGEFALINDL